MLAIHLDDTTHMASRAGPVVTAHVDWLVARLEAAGRRRNGGRRSGGGEPTGGGWRILDVTCGPGLYCHELARRGWPSVGVDIAPAALRHAREVAATESLACLFLAADVTALPADLPERLGPLAAVTFWFGEFHSLPRADGARLLGELATCLEPGGLLVLEYQPWETFPREPETAWTVTRRTPFHDGLQLWLQEWAWDENEHALVDVHWILDAERGRLQRFEQCHRAYRDEELTEMIAAAGLVEHARHGPITGCDPSFEFPVLVAVRR
jgi:SAM-dependent methyltransferase